MKKNNRFLIIGILLTIITIVAIGTLSACTQSTSTQTVTTTSAPQTTTQQAAPIEIKVAGPFPATNPTTIHFMDSFFKPLEEATEGRLKFTYYLGTVLTQEAMVDGLIAGVVDIALASSNYAPGRFPLSEIMYFPPAFDKAEQGNAIIMEFFQKHMQQLPEWDGIKVLMLNILPSVVMTVDQPVYLPSDMNGLTMRSTGGIILKVIQEGGGTPLTLPATELYDALQKGMIDGFISVGNSLKTFQAGEVIKNVTKAPLGGGPFYIMMSSDRYNSLPDDLKEIINDVAAQALPKMGKFEDTDVEGGYQFMYERQADKGLTTQIITLSDDQSSAWLDLDCYDTWVTDREAEGLPARQLMEDRIAFLKQYFSYMK